MQTVLQTWIDIMSTCIEIYKLKSGELVFARCTANA